MSDIKDTAPHLSSIPPSGNTTSIQRQRHFSMPSFPTTFILLNGSIILRDDSHHRRCGPPSQTLHIFHRPLCRCRLHIHSSSSTTSCSLLSASFKTEIVDGPSRYIRTPIQDARDGPECRDELRTKAVQNRIRYMCDGRLADDDNDYYSSV